MLPLHQDFVINQDWVDPNGTPTGPVATMLTTVGGDPSLSRPYLNPDDGNRAYISVPTGKFVVNKATGLREKEYVEVRVKDFRDDTDIHLPVWNATTLRKEEWLELDREIVGAARYPLKAWSDLAASSTKRVDAMRKMILEYETGNDPGVAVEDMDGMTEGRNDLPLNKLEGLPLSIKHVDFFVSKRVLGVSRNNPDSAIDTRMGEAAGARLGEMVEKQVIGLSTGPIYGGNSTLTGGYGRTSQIYGYTNFPARMTKTNLTTPTTTNQSTTISEILTILNDLKGRKQFGPFMVYTTNDWDPFLDADYILTGGNVATQTLRQRILAIPDVMGVRRLDMWFATQPQTNPYYATTTQTGTTGQAIYTGPGGEGIDATLKAYSLLVVNMSKRTAQAVIGMDITTIQWETMGGQRLNFKVMCSYQPIIYADYYGNCGVYHATTS